MGFVCFPGGSDGKESAYNAGDLGSIPGLGRAPEEGNGNPPQYSCLENSMDRGTWQATLHGVAKCQVQLSTEHKHSFYIVLAFYHRKHQKQFHRDISQETYSEYHACVYVLSRYLFCLLFALLKTHLSFQRNQVFSFPTEHFCMYSHCFQK